MDQRRLGQLSLRTDAAYCALTALLLLIFARPLSGALAVPARVILAAAAGSAGWALVLRRAAGRARLRSWLVRVFVANVVAAGLIAVLALTRPPDALSLLLVAVSLEVAAFAASQAFALIPRA